MKTKILLTALVMTLTVLGWTNLNQSQVNGEVRSQDGKAIMFSSLEIYTNETEPHFVQSTTTDFDGKFKIKNLKPGAYQLVVKAEGFDNKVQVVNLARNKNHLEIIEMKGDVVILDPVIIRTKMM